MNVIVQLFPFASWAEIFQLGASTVGLALAIWSLWNAGEDAVNLSHTSARDPRRLIALGHLRGHLARMIAHGVLFSIGLVSCLLPPPFTPTMDTVPELLQAFYVRIGLILVTMILVIDMYFERRQRDKFLAEDL